MRIYQAGPFFTAAELAFNKDLASMLRCAGHEVFLPQEHELQLTKGYAFTTFSVDRAGLDWADAIVAVLDGSDVDSGTAWECGYAYAKGKPVYGFRTDFRILGPEEKCNLMIQECCVGVVGSVKELFRLMGTRE